MNTMNAASQWLRRNLPKSGMVPADRFVDVLPVSTLMACAFVMMGYTMWHNLGSDPDVVIWDKHRRKTDWLSEHPNVLKESANLHKTPFRSLAEWGNQHYRNYTENMYSDRKSYIHFTTD